ncbi:hypothetical protein EC917_12978 [Bacillus thuringiensis]|uniref:DUF3796 domain-containing protein n=1 Tax=Bacillus thuringiensis TaxID=1428 RepID=A0A4R4AZU6_BACTU|nr:hypothetical protein EC917_12978 [Bacillus thuringiensis]TCW46353.1 hypothetical protein EC910_12877 [Bacillus thuringiensis]
MKNKLAYLGLLGFFGFLGPFTFLGNISWAYYFFGFFFFFAYAKVVPDSFLCCMFGSPLQELFS